MNRFNVGDRVQFIHYQLVLCNTTKAIFDLKNRYGTVRTELINLKGYIYEVEFDAFPIQVERCAVEHLQAAPKFPIPPAMDAWLGNISIDNFLVAKPSASAVIKPKCTCGGFKTFNTMDEHAHSSWCDSRSKVSNG